MLTIPIGPLRESDLTNTWDALRARGERILGFTQLPAERLIATTFGLVINQTGAVRKWVPSGPRTVSHLVDIVESESDEFGIHTVLNHEIDKLPAGDFIAVCPAFRLPQAAEYLRVEHIGPRLYVYTAATRHCEIAAAALSIPTRPANDNRLPSIIELRYGRLLRFDSASAEALIRYFNLPTAINSNEPMVVDLGGESILAVARTDQSEAHTESGEAMRGIITKKCFEPTAVRDIARWLKTAKTTKRQVTTPP